MIKQLLKNSTCADCRMCCIFDRYDVWETPLFEESAMEAVKSAVPTAEFAKKGNGYVLNVGKMTDVELFSCPALAENGCILGNSKPFDCRIWPFRIMKFNECRVIAVSSLCEAVYGQSHEELRQFLKQGLAKKIFEYADNFPQAVHQFYDNYTILVYENEITK